MWRPRVLGGAKAKRGAVLAVVETGAAFELDPSIEDQGVVQLVPEMEWISLSG